MISCINKGSFIIHGMGAVSDQAEWAKYFVRSGVGEFLWGLFCSGREHFERPNWLKGGLHTIRSGQIGPI